MTKQKPESDLIITKEETPADMQKKPQDYSEFFELQLIQSAMDSHKHKDYLNSALMSWSYVEEYFLPTSIKFIAKQQKLQLSNKLLENVTVQQLIRYYLFISYDSELFGMLETARKLRNQIVHNIYRNKSLNLIEERAKESATYNLHKLTPQMFDREEGKVVAPSLLIAMNARNDLRKEIRTKLKLL